MRHWVLGALLLPGSVLLLIPASLLLLFPSARWGPPLASPSAPEFWLALLVGLAGAALAVWTASLFARFGQGTPAPWAPPRRFVVRGPYRHVRNPMITGVCLLLLCETLLLRSWPILLWLLLFMAANALYIPRVEEKGLAKRFGTEYLVYKRHVPRWIPQLRAWMPAQEQALSRPPRA